MTESMSISSLARKLSITAGQRRHIQTSENSGLESVSLYQSQNSVLSGGCSQENVSTRDRSSSKKVRSYTIESQRVLVSGKFSLPSQKSDAKAQLSIRSQNCRNNASSAGQGAVTSMNEVNMQPEIKLKEMITDVQKRIDRLKWFRSWSDQIHQEASRHSRRPNSCQDPLQKPSLKKREITIPKNLERQRSENPVTQEAPPTEIKPQQQFAQPVKQDIHQDLFFKPHSTDRYSVQGTTFPNTGVARPATSDSTIIPQRGRSTSKRRITISAAPMDQSASGTVGTQGRNRARSRIHENEKRYPPVSYPKHLDESVITGVQKAQRQPLGKSRNASTSISPMTRPVPSQDSETGHSTEPAVIDHGSGKPDFYSTIHYYADCPHVSPPANRPLDPGSQPRPDPNSYSVNHALIRSIILGRCFTCDTQNRRAKEGEVMRAFDNQIAEVTEMLDSLSEHLRQLNILEPEWSDDEEILGNPRYHASLSSYVTFPEDIYDLDEELGDLKLPPLSDDLEVSTYDVPNHSDDASASLRSRANQHICLLEREIERLRCQQDEEVRSVWSGFTRRWGPATLGIQRGGWSQDVERCQTKDCRSALLEYTSRDIDARLKHPDGLVLDNHRELSYCHQPGTDERNTDGPSQALKPALLDSPFATPRRESRDKNRGRRSLSLGRDAPSTPTSHWSTTSNVSHRDTPGSRTPGEGRMRIGWIRE